MGAFVVFLMLCFGFYVTTKVAYIFYRDVMRTHDTPLSIHVIGLWIMYLVVFSILSVVLFPYFLFSSKGEARFFNYMHQKMILKRNELV